MTKLHSWSIWWVPSCGFGPFKFWVTPMVRTLKPVTRMFPLKLHWTISCAHEGKMVYTSVLNSWVCFFNSLWKLMILQGLWKLKRYYCNKYVCQWWVVSFHNFRTCCKAHGWAWTWVSSICFSLVQLSSNTRGFLQFPNYLVTFLFLIVLFFKCKT